MNFGSDECTEIVIIGVETNLLSPAAAVLKHVVSKDFIFKKSVQGAGSVSCQECRNLWHYFISKIFHVRLHYFFKKTSTCAHGSHKWVTSRLFCGLVGQIG